jgi:hypothetical protein
MPRAFKGSMALYDSMQIALFDEKSQNECVSENRSTRMAEGCLRNDFLCMPSGIELRVPDFTRLLDDAVISAGPAETVTPKRTREDVARSASDDLEAFRLIASGYGFTPIMVELAIFNDELLQIAFDPTERLAPTHTGGLPELKFLSVSASYEEFRESPTLLRAWHRASHLVVDQDKESTVGEKHTYDYAYLWDHLSSQEIKCASADIGRFARQPEPTGIVIVDGLANVMPPISYPLGVEAIRRLIEHWGAAKSGKARLAHPPNRAPQSIVHNLLSYFAAASFYEKSDPVQSILAKTVLLVVPFTRPWLFRMEDPSKQTDEEPTSRPGGGVFMLLKVDDDLMATDNLLETSLRGLSSAIDYVVFQASMLEAQQQRFMTREVDLSLFGHTISAQLREAETDCSRAVVEAKEKLSGDSTVMKYMNNAYASVQRLERVSETARTAVLMRSGRAAPFSFSSPAVSFTDFQLDFSRRCHSAMVIARGSINDPTRLRAIRDVTYEPIQWPQDGPWLVKTNSEYLSMLINELMRNALVHGNFNDRRQIEVKVKLEDKYMHNDKYIYLEMRNPIQLTPTERQNLDSMLSRKSLSLGITQIEILARTYRIPLPCFEALDTDFSVRCVVAEKIITVPSSTSAGAQ